ncbi:MAG: SNF2-related protein [Crocinitomicaceae bacterium]
MITLKFRPFQEFIDKNTIERTRSRFMDSTVLTFEMDDHSFKAMVQGSRKYDVHIEFDSVQVKKATCSCPYSGEGACKHIVNVMFKADQQRRRLEAQEEKEDNHSNLIDVCRIDDKLILENQLVLDLDVYEVESVSAPRLEKYYAWDMMRIMSSEVKPDHFSGTLYNPRAEATQFSIIEKNGNTVMYCSCDSASEQLCSHLNFLLLEILDETELQLSFNPQLRHSLLRKNATDLGMKNPKNLDDIFSIKIENGRVFIQPKINILDLNARTMTTLKKELIPEFQFPKSVKKNEFEQFLLISENQYSDQLDFKWMKAPLTKKGTIKSPLSEMDILEEMKSDVNPEILPFYLALLKQKMADNDSELSEKIAQAKQLIKNPLDLSFFYFQNDKFYASKVTPKSIKPIEIKRVETSASIYVKQQDDYYVLTCTVKTDNIELSSQRMKFVGSFYFWQGETLNLVDNLAIIRVINFFAENKHELFIHKSQFTQFQEEFLQKLEQSISVKYEYVKKAPARLIKQQSLDAITEYMIYLGDSEDYVTITPVVAYGETEVAALSRRSIFAENPAGGLYSIERREVLEQRFIRTVREQHPHFEDQYETDFFYLHKQEFLESGWFLDAFEEWRKNEYSILGFNQLRDNRMNAHKMSVQTSVSSGIDWFEIHAKVSFGDQAASLKEVQKAVVNKTRYIKLGNGTLGVMPKEWIEKFSSYFRSGVVKDDFIKAHHTNFQLIDDLFEKEIMSEEAVLKLTDYQEKLSSFLSIETTEVPQKLNATLRDYQKEGLSWLNFLDEFGFGGCLADDMGLGKTIQMIAYLLLQAEKGRTDANLVIVPTSLLFNWQLELDKFAPHLKRVVVYGADRKTKSIDFSKYDIVITSYGTMLSDIEYLKAYRFNCIILDESQAIKNPSSKRYKAARLLEGRQRLVMTGTPLENNTFDLYAQLSFVLPGLFGSAQRFKDEYSTPIDKFKETKRAKELQQKIHPFVLRRTKTQVAKELPEKTEIVLHCEMGLEQQRVYDAYKQEFQIYLKKQETDSLNRNSLHVLQGLMKLRQICNSPALLSDDEYYGDESAKLSVLMEQISTLKDNHKILVFSQFVGMLELVKSALEKENIEYAYLTGKTKKRQEQVDNFQSDENVRVFLISLKAGGTGLNLTKAEYVFLIDPWWNPAVENQAIDRAHRIGQENKVVAVRLITPNTIEEKIMELQSRKKELVQDLVHTDTTILKQLSQEDLLGML